MQSNNTAKSKITLKIKITFIILGILSSFILLEAGLRAGGFVLLSMQEHRNKQAIKQKGSYRIMCLGESTTQGQYPPFLQEILNQSNAAIKFSVIDKGLDGTTVLAILERLNSNLDRYHPDMVVTMMGHDLGAHISYEASTASKSTLFFRSLRTYKLVRIIWLNTLAKVNQAWLYRSTDESMSPEDSLKKAMEQNPKKVDIYNALGVLYWDQGKFSQAEDVFKKAMEQNPEKVNGYDGLSWLYRIQGKFSQGEDLFKRAIKSDPQNTNAYIALGQLYREQKKFPQAEDILQKAIGLHPEEADAYVDLGWLYRDQGKFSQAEDVFKKVIEREPDQFRLYIYLGWLYLDQVKFSQAEEAFKKAIEVDPANKDYGYAALSVLYEKMGKPQLAKEYADKVNMERLRYYNPVTVNSYRQLRGILDKRGIKYVCVQYPMTSIEPLKKIFEGNEQGIIFVDNERIFKDAVNKADSKAYFRDMMGGDFGHCTEKGNRLLAENIANVILKEVFNR